MVIGLKGAGMPIFQGKMAADDCRDQVGSTEGSCSPSHMAIIKIDSNVDTLITYIYIYHTSTINPIVFKTTTSKHQKHL